VFHLCDRNHSKLETWSSIFASIVLTLFVSPVVGQLFIMSVLGLLTSGLRNAYFIGICEERNFRYHVLLGSTCTFSSGRKLLQGYSPSESRTSIVVDSHLGCS